jgi:hypothetical protein
MVWWRREESVKGTGKLLTVQQIAVSTVDLDKVESSLFASLYSIDKRLLDSLDVCSVGLLRVGVLAR